VKNEERFRAIFDTINEAVYIHDFEGNILETNLKASEYSGYSNKELMKMHIPDIDVMCDITKINSLLQEIRDKGEVFFESVHKRIDGTMVNVEINARAMNFDGEPKVLALVRDITERKKIERELYHKNKELEQIVHITSHDLRSPLVNVQGYSKEIGLSMEELKKVISEVELSPGKSEKIRTILEDDVSVSLKFIETSVTKMELLLKGLLLFSRSGTMAIKLEILDMNDLISKVIADFEFKIKTNKINFEISDLPECKGDHVMVSHVFSNLIDNAIKYLAPEREGIIKISGTKKNGRSVYYVEDNGIGIANEHINNIFDIFYRLNPKSIDGVGLGLSLVQKILSRLNGGIAVESEIDKGSKFYITLPGSSL
jgi:PAS domain S-box-containing protein